MGEEARLLRLLQGGTGDVPATANIHHHPVTGGRGPRKKVADGHIDGSQAKKVTAIAQRRPPRGFLDKVPKEVRLRQIETLDASLRHDTAVVHLPAGGGSAVRVLFTAPGLATCRHDGTVSHSGQQFDGREVAPAVPVKASLRGGTDGLLVAAKLKTSERLVQW